MNNNEEGLYGDSKVILVYTSRITMMVVLLLRAEESKGGHEEKGKR